MMERPPGFNTKCVSHVKHGNQDLLCMWSRCHLPFPYPFFIHPCLTCQIPLGFIFDSHISFIPTHFHCSVAAWFPFSIPSALYRNKIAGLFCCSIALYYIPTPNGVAYLQAGSNVIPPMHGNQVPTLQASKPTSWHALSCRKKTVQNAPYHFDPREFDPPQTPRGRNEICIENV